MKMLVVGAGSVGGYFGGRLAAAGRDVTFLVRAQRAAQLAAGLVIATPGGRTTIPVRTLRASQVSRDFDVILVAVKAYQLQAAVEDFGPFVTEGTLVVPLLNGIRHLELLRARFGAARVVGGVAKIGTSLNDDGWIIDQGRFHDLAFGEFSRARTARIDALDSFLRVAGFDARVSPDIERELWEKWAMLAAVGAVTCLMDGTLGEVARVPGGADIAGRMFAEVCSVIESEWQPLEPAFKEQTLAMLTDTSSPQTSSMFRDLKAGRPIEADQIIGDLVARALGRGTAIPLLSCVLARLRVYEGRAAAG